MRIFWLNCIILSILLPLVVSHWKDWKFPIGNYTGKRICEGKCVETKTGLKPSPQCEYWCEFAGTPGPECMNYEGKDQCCCLPYED